MIEHVPQMIAIAAGLPVDPIPRAPSGSEKIVEIVDNAKWAAGAALMLGFFVGLTVWAGGRWVDHHRAGRVGVVMMLSAVAGGLLYGIGYQLISHFAEGG